MKIHRRSLKLLSYVLACLAGTAFSVFGEMREFTSVSGQKLKAELVSYRGNDVTLKREDGREFKVTPAAFGLDDQIYIKEWMAKTPEAKSYSLRIDAEKKKMDGTQVNMGYKKVKNEKWAYKVTMTNLSRDTAENLTIKYKVFYSNYADGEFDASASDVTNLGMVEGEVKVREALPYNKTLEFITKEVQVDIVDYDYYEKYKDSIKGTMVRVLDSNGKVVADWVMPISFLKGKTWDNTDPQSDNRSKVIIK